MAELLRARLLFRRPGLSLAPTYGSQPSTTAVQRLYPLLVSPGVAYVWCTGIYAGKTAIHIKEK